MIDITVVLVGILFYIFYLWGFTKPKNFPPGPPRVPFMGSMPWVPKSKEGPIAGITNFEWKKKYGNVTGFYMGFKPTIMIQDVQVAKEALGREEYSDRTQGMFNTEIRGINGKAHGIIFENGETWKTQRRFSLKTLRDFGFGKVSLDSHVAFEARAIVEHLSKSNGKDLRIEGNFNVAVLNVIWIILANKRYDFDDPTINDLSNRLTAMFRVGNNWIEYFPWLARAFPTFTGLSQSKKNLQDLHREWRKEIQKHKDDETEERNDFIDAYLKAMKSDPGLTENDLVQVIQDFFAAGSETTSTTLMWCVMYMALNPEVQRRIHDEIDASIGQDKEVDMNDQDQLIYTSAAILEVQRLSATAPGVIPHVTSRASTLDGYDIPEGTIVMMNTIGMMRSEEYWKDPEEFQPERFIRDGRIVKPDAFVPFGVGKRLCLGETLAKRELFIFFATIMQKMRFSRPTEHPEPDPEDCTSGVTRIPQPFYVHVECR